MNKSATRYEQIVESSMLADAMKAYLEKQRWFRSKERKIERAEIIDWTEESVGSETALRLFVRATFDIGDPETYFVPVVSASGETPAAPGVVAELEMDGSKKLFFDAFSNPDFGKRLFKEMAEGGGWRTRGGRVEFLNHGLRLPGEVEASDLRLLSVEQSNSAIIYKKDLMLKIFRKMEGETSPEVEMLLFLKSRGYPHVPSLFFDARYEAPDGNVSTLMLLLNFIPNTGDGWKRTVASLGAIYEQFLGSEPSSTVKLGPAFALAARGHLDLMRELGAITGEMHAKLSSEPDDPAFNPEAIDPKVVERWRSEYEALAADALRLLGKRKSEAGDPAAAACRMLIDGGEKLRERSKILMLLADEGVCRIRCHEDFHLGQVLCGDSGLVICDFEGQPARGIRERKEKYCVLKDVAGMLRSFDYVAHVSEVEFRKQHKVDGELEVRLKRLKRLWLESTRRAFLSAYFEAVRAEGSSSFLSSSPEKNAKLLSFFELEKSFAELIYELKNRPDWIGVPIEGIRRHLL